MEHTEKEYIITIDTLWRVFKKAILWMIVAALISGGIALAFSLVTYTPVYTTTVSFYLLNTEYQDSADTAGMQYNNILLAHAAAEDCVYMLTLKEIKETACAKAGASPSSVSIKVDMPISEESCVVSIRATAESPETAYTVANAVFDSGKTLVKDASSLDMNIISHGEVASEPSNSRIATYVFFAVFVGAVAVYAGFLLHRIFNSKITSEEDAEAVLGVSVLGVIPNRDKAAGKRYGKYSKYSKYAKYAKYERDV